MPTAITPNASIGSEFTGFSAGGGVAAGCGSGVAWASLSRYTQPAAGAATCSGATSNFGRVLRRDGGLGSSELLVGPLALGIFLPFVAYGAGDEADKISVVLGSAASRCIFPDGLVSGRGI